MVQKRGPEPVGEAAIEGVLADVPERRVAEVVTEPDGLHQVLVQGQRRATVANLGDLERVREPRAVVIAAWSHEHLGLVLQASKRLAVDDPVAISLKRRAQAAVGLGAHGCAG